MDGQLYFIFQLAEHLHYTVGELEEKLSVTELVEWEQYFRTKKYHQDKS